MTNVWAIQYPAGFSGFRSYRSQPFGDEMIYDLSSGAPELVVLRRGDPDDAPAFRATRLTLGGRHPVRPHVSVPARRH